MNTFVITVNISNVFFFYFLQAVGEPPLFLAASVFYAIKDAVTAARAESGFTGPFRLDSPATPERIRNACEDRFTKLVRHQSLFQNRPIQFITILPSCRSKLMIKLPTNTVVAIQRFILPLGKFHLQREQDLPLTSLFIYFLKIYI